MKNVSSNRYVISVLVPDRTGILRDVTSALTDLGANIDEIRQSVVEGYFTLTLTATLSNALDAPAIQRAIEQNFNQGEMSLIVRPFEPVTPPSALSGGATYILTLTGKDRPGILKRLTAYLADKGINIEDWDCQFKQDIVTYIGELTVPEKLLIGQIQAELQAEMDDLGMRCTMQHQNIFRATNEIGPIRALLKEGGHA